MFELEKLKSVSKRDLRTAIRRVSPFEPNGLGTYDYLRMISDVDEVFLFCSQLLFYNERGLIEEVPERVSNAE